MRNSGLVVVGTLVTIVVVIALLIAYARGGSATVEGSGYKPAFVAVTDVSYGVAYPVGHTFLCSEAGVGIARDWHFTDRWVKNQLSYDRYVVDGRSFETLQFVTNDPALPPGHVRFRKELVDVGAGPRLEGHDYQKTLINGRVATIQKELLFVDYNGVLEPQARPLSACGAPRR